MSLRNNLKNLLGYVLGSQYRGIGNILMLHSVVPQSDAFRVHNSVNEITPAELDDLIKIFRKNDIDFVSIDQVPEKLTDRSTRRFVCLTFDDGFLDNYQYAYPVFRNHNIPMTIYITTGFPDHTYIIWWYLLEKVLVGNALVRFHWDGQVYDYKALSKEDKENTFNEIRRLIIDTPYTDQKTYLQTAFQEYVDDPTELTVKMAMSWDQIRELSESELVTIGAHSINHPALNQLQPEDVNDEVVGSLTRIAKQIDQEVTHFAYPFGSSKEAGVREFDLIRSMGISTAVTTRWGSIFPDHKHHLESLPRISFANYDYALFHRILSGREQFVRSSFKRVVTI